MIKDVHFRIITTPKNLREIADKMEHAFSVGLTQAATEAIALPNGVEVSFVGDETRFEQQKRGEGNGWS